MDPSALAALIIGYVAQFARAHPNIPAWSMDVAVLGIGLGCFIIANPPVGDIVYWRDAIAFAFALPGIGSVSAHIGLAPKTT
jgi:hypothetical protein